MGLVLFYTHFWLSRVLTAGLLCLDPPYRWYCTVSSLMRSCFFYFIFSFRFPLLLWLLREGIRESIWLEIGVYDGVSFSVWFEYVSFGTTVEAMVWSAVFFQEAGKLYIS